MYDEDDLYGEENHDLGRYEDFIDMIIEVFDPVCIVTVVVIAILIVALTKF